MLDILIEDRGTAALMRPLTHRGRQWVEQHVEYQKESEGAVVIDSHKAHDIARAAIDDGMSVRIDDES